MEILQRTKSLLMIKLEKLLDKQVNVDEITSANALDPAV